MDKGYCLQDYYELLKESFELPVEVDFVRNKLGQDSVRIRYVINKLKEFDMFIFGSDFAVAYKPNGRVKMYESLTPKQVKYIIDRVLLFWRAK